MSICLYCGLENELFSKEHVIPQALGGNLTPQNPFAIRNVCTRCNNLAGTYIDGPFIKSWMNQNYRSSAIMKYANIDSNLILPLSYMGIIKKMDYEGKICELWIGPTGDTIYHFHEPYPAEPNTTPMVGVPTYARNINIDRGFAFIFVRSNNPEWHPTILLSFREQFRKSELFLGNGPTPPGGDFSDIPHSLNALHQDLISLLGEHHEVEAAIGISYGDRFLAKIALGLGSILLKSGYETSNSANMLRKAMWTRDAAIRATIPIHGSNFFQISDSHLKGILTWPGGHLLHIRRTSNKLVLYASFYEVQNAVIEISNEPRYWEGISGEGLIYVIAPGLRKYVGPKKFEQFVAHKLVSDYVDYELKLLEDEMNLHTVLPPFNI